MTAVRLIRVGTRASRLARVQTAAVVDALGIDVTTVPISTEGDRSSAALAQIGGTGVFVSALREALVNGEIDVAVHSYKDLPTAPDDRVHVAAVPTRADARDVLIARDGRTLGELPDGARVGTGSPRRAAQLHALGMGLDVVPVRGNVDTRLGLVAAGTIDAVVLAYAGLARLGRGAEVSEILDPLQMLPAPAQGALAIECRAGDAATIALLAPLEHPDTRAVVTAERALLTTLEAGCSSPVGALGEIAEGDAGPEIYLRANVTAPDGSDAVRLSRTGSTTDAEAVGRLLAADLLAAGADKIMERST